MLAIFLTKLYLGL
uniref:Uncharacterized protein n=1 Tax=Anguilla anguilla TaxID=7936 RepID=A0A0E9RLH4_ANGAN